MIPTLMTGMAVPDSHNRTPCYGQGDLFDKTDDASHAEAKALCDQCPFTEWCMAEYRAAFAASGDHYYAKPVGTWHGTLYRDIDDSNGKTREQNRRNQAARRERERARKANGAPRKLTRRNDYDPITVDRIIGGEHRLPAGVNERLEVIRRWKANGQTLNQLEQLTGWNVYRIIRENQQGEETAA